MEILSELKRLFRHCLNFSISLVEFDSQLFMYGDVYSECNYHPLGRFSNDTDLISKEELQHKDSFEDHIQQCIKFQSPIH